MERLESPPLKKKRKSPPWHKNCLKWWLLSQKWPFYFKQFADEEIGWVVSVSSPGCVCFFRPSAEFQWWAQWSRTHGQRTIRTTTASPPPPSPMTGWSWILGGPWRFFAERLPGDLWGCWERYQLGLGLLLGTECFIQWGKVVLDHMNKDFRFWVGDCLTLSFFLGL